MKERDVVGLKFVLSIIVVFSINCVPVTPVDSSDDMEVASHAVENFHKLLNEQRYEELYELTDDRAKATKSKEAFLRVMGEVRSRFGECVESSLVDVNVVARAAFQEVRLTYRSKFEKAIRNEGFVWYVENGKAKLYEYEIELR